MPFCLFSQAGTRKALRTFALQNLSTTVHEPSKLEGRWLALSSSAQADFLAVECLSTPCQSGATLCTSDCSKSGLVGGL